MDKKDSYKSRSGTISLMGKNKIQKPIIGRYKDGKMIIMGDVTPHKNK